MNQSLKVVLEADIKQMQTALSSAKKRLKDFEGEVQTTDKGVQKFGKTTKDQATPALTSFSQVIQDAPYGIRGVANNIQQLTMQMGYLASQSNGTRGIFKALAGSLIGPGGILLAVSVVTSLLVAYGDKLEFVASQAEKLAEATKKYVGEAKAEISNLRILIGIAEDSATATDVRRAAIEKINDKYGKYLGNLDLERLKTDEVKAAVDRLTKSLITQAKIKGLEDMITEKTTESAEKLIELDLEKTKSAKKVETQINRLIKGNADLNRQLSNVKGVNNQIAALNELANSGTGLGDYVRNNIGGVQIAIDEYQGLNKELKEIESNTDKAIAPLVKLQSKFEKDVLGLEVQPTFSQEEVVIESGKKPKVEVEPVVDSAAIAELNKKIKEAQAEGAFLDQELSMTMPTENAIGEAGYANNLNESWLTLETQFDEHKDRMGEKMTEYNSMMNEEAMMLSSIFSQMSNQIIDGLLSGEMSVESFVKSSIKALGSLLVNMAQQAIAEKLIGKAQMATDQGVANANAIVMASNAAAAMGPAGVIAYPGLLASQLAITNGAFGAIQAFNDGGIVGGGMVTGDKVLARMNSGEMVLKNSQQRNLFRMLDGAHLGGGSEPLEIYGETITRGDDLVTVLRRTEKKNSRIN